jgi:hypothetical protein
LSMLKTLGAELAECHALFNACPNENDERLGALFEQHWSLRARINQKPAQTLEDLRAKVSAAGLALQQDETAECDAEGSFVELCKSINRDIAALMET